MPYVNNDSVNIHYEVFGTGTPLVVGYGLFGSIERLNDRGWIDILSSEFKVVIPEYRAHGKSDTPSDHSLFTLEHRVSDVIAVMNDAGIDRAAYFGYSLGAVVGYGLAGDHENRFSSFVLGGAHPYEKDNSWVKSLVNERRVKGLMPDDFDVTPFFSILDHDEKGTGVDPAQIQSPCFVFYGGDDRGINEARRVAAELPNSEYLELEGLGHRAAFEPTDQLTSAVLRFLQQNT
mgnify:CR=1 FL=1|jgi:pimeloyl-ACP methyl ester carboxylesterase